jgi:hypothetical protein
MPKPHTRNQAFFALVHLLQGSGRAKSRSRAAAMGVVDHEILPIVAAGFRTYPELTVEEILEVCRPALIEVLQHIIDPNSRK